MEHSLRRSAVPALICLLTVGYIDDSLAPPASAGVYALVTRNGAAMPVLIGDAATGRASLEGGILRLEPDRSFTIRYDEGITEGPVMTYHMTIVMGTYSERGATVTLTAWGGGAMRATRTGEAITLADRDARLVFRR